MSESNSSSSTNPPPPRMRSTAELRTWLQDCEHELARLDMRLSRGKPVGSLEFLSVRLALISEILGAQRNGVALVDAETQLFELMLGANMTRLRELRAALDTTSPQATDGPELPLEPQSPSATS